MSAPAAPAERRPRKPPRRRSAWIPPIVGALLLAAIGFLIWYFAFRSSEDSSTTSPESVSVLPRSLDFGDIDLGKRSAALTATLRYAGSTPLGIASIDLAGADPKDFRIARATKCSTEAPLNENASCTIVMRFRPRSRGARAARLVLQFNGGRDPAAVRLRGTGVGEPAVVVETTRLGFGTQKIGARGDVRKVALRNVGNAPLLVESIEIEGAAADEFARGGSGRESCSPQRRVKAGAGCTLSVRFEPVGLGRRRATLVVTHDADGSPTRIQLQGVATGEPKAVVSPQTVDFGSVRVRGESKPETVTVKNGGTDTMTVESIRVRGENVESFDVTGGGTCAGGVELEPKDACTVTVRFSPTRRGPREATLVIGTDTAQGTSSVGLEGTGRRRSASRN